MQGKNKLLFRYLEKELKAVINKKQSCLIFGPRQVGKTTLVNFCLPNNRKILKYPLQRPGLRQDLESDPEKIIREVEAEKNFPIVFIDEAQKIPKLFDAVQYLIDNKKAQFIITGSSARKLRKSGTNLLPGRVKKFNLDPLLFGEQGQIKSSAIKELSIKNINHNINFTISDSLVYGSLPGITSLATEEREDFLRAYSVIYLEEEIRAEALSRNIGAFSRFLELAATESGTAPNLSKLSQESGVSIPTIKEYYSLLEDTLVAERIDPYIKNARKRILSTSRYYFFDIGVRNTLARLPLSKKLVNAQKGVLFEHAVVLEIIRRIKILKKNFKLYYWRTSGGAEVDLIIDTGEKLIPIEIKSSTKITLSDVRGLKIFLDDYNTKTKQGYVVFMGERREKITENITAIPWFQI
jgi:predicted AAA+ superfamily ATPase